MPHQIQSPGACGEGPSRWGKPCRTSAASENLGRPSSSRWSPSTGSPCSQGQPPGGSSAKLSTGSARRGPSPSRRFAFCRNIFTSCGRFRQAMQTSRLGGLPSRVRSLGGTSRPAPSPARRRSPAGRGERFASGRGATGSTASATRRISPGTWTTSTTIPSNTGTWCVRPTGRGPRFTGSQGMACTKPLWGETESPNVTGLGATVAE